MTATAYLDTLTRGLGRGARRGCLPYGVRERLEVVGLRRLIGLADGQPDDIPAARRRHPVRVPSAQVVAVRLDKCRKRAENRRGVAIDVRERVQSGLFAGGPGTLASSQLTITPVSCWHPAERSTRVPVGAGS